MSASNRLVLHEAKATFLYWVVPVFVLLACVLVAANLWLPVLAPAAGAAPGALRLALAVLATALIPVGAALMVFLIPQITTTVDPQRRMLVIEYRRPLGRSFKEYPLTGLADIRPVMRGQRRYALVAILRSGEQVRLDYRLLPEAARQQQASRLKAQLAPYWLGPTG
jgi:hypothetical protein